jgi:hypothetical protein
MQRRSIACISSLIIVANGIVEQHLARHPAKVAEGPLQALEPSLGVICGLIIHYLMLRANTYYTGLLQRTVCRLSLPPSGTATPLSAVGKLRSAPYLVETATSRGYCLAGYQFLWKALPIARSEETTVKAQ